MFNHLIEFLAGTPPDGSSGKPDQLQIAVAALLVQAAAMDDVFERAEREAIARLLAQHFALDAPAVARLIATAEDRSERSTQLYPFIRVLLERLDGDGRIAVIEMLWDVAYADGVLHPDEDALIRRIGGLLFVSDHDRGDARKRVLLRLRNPDQSDGCADS